MEIDVLYEDARRSTRWSTASSGSSLARHGGEDFTVTTQQQMLDVLGSVSTS